MYANACECVLQVSVFFNQVSRFGKGYQYIYLLETIKWFETNEKNTAKQVRIYKYIFIRLLRFNLNRRRKKMNKLT